MIMAKNQAESTKKYLCICARALYNYYDFHHASMLISSLPCTSAAFQSDMLKAGCWCRIVINYYIPIGSL